MIVISTFVFSQQIKSYMGVEAMYDYPRLRELREDRDLVQKEVAAVLQIDQRVYSNYETGKREIPLHLAIRLAAFYEVSLDYLTGRTNDPLFRSKK
ncbi:helix-turn-helix transcriptional regulator [Oscillibacter ruminantium]|uniref:helix-turn-helix domain-containing protein n=2 Tax=Oscillibacter ruminantium TaxID=1263547 RepID=UPI002B21905A|nr:helix-turn-helix transcriptional regulator [Oscillibacter ruminantium]